MSVPFRKTQPAPSMSRPGLLHKTKQTPGGNCCLVWGSKDPEQSVSRGRFPESVCFVCSEEKFRFFVKETTVG